MADQDHKLHMLQQKLNDSINNLQRAERNNLPALVIKAIHENIENLKKEINFHQIPPPPCPAQKKI